MAGTLKHIHKNSAPLPKCAPAPAGKAKGPSKKNPSGKTTDCPDTWPGSTSAGNAC